MKDLMDSTNCDILDSRREARDGLWGPRIGDFVRMLDGTVRRFTHDWGDDIQTTNKNSNGTSFYLAKDGHASFSGGLDRAIKRSTLKELDEVLPGSFWIEHHGYLRAGCAVNVTIDCRVFKQEREG